MLRPYARFERVGLRVDGVTVLDDVSFALAERRVALVGANGSGKSTLLRCLNALAAPTSGRVLLDVEGPGAAGPAAAGPAAAGPAAAGRDASGPAAAGPDAAGPPPVDPARSPAAARALVGFVFTDPDAQVVMPTPAEDVALSLRRLRLPADERRARVQEALASVGLGHRADTSVHDLSSGQRQLLAIAAVLATAPRLLVLDEPTTLLDLRNTGLVRDTLDGVGVPVVMATHDLALAATCDRVLVVDEGRVVLDGTPETTLEGYRDLMGTLR